MRSGSGGSLTTAAGVPGRSHSFTGDRRSLDPTAPAPVRDVADTLNGLVGGFRLDRRSLTSHPSIASVPNR